jgi:hypothetical protein
LGYPFLFFRAPIGMLQPHITSDEARSQAKQQLDDGQFFFLKKAALALLFIKVKEKDTA